MGSSTMRSTNYGRPAAQAEKPAVASGGVDTSRKGASAQAALLMAPWMGGLSRSDDQLNDGWDGWWGATLCASPSLLGPDILGMGRTQPPPLAEEVVRVPRRHPSERKMTYALSPASNDTKMPSGKCGASGATPGAKLGANQDMPGVPPKAQREAYPVRAERGLTD